MCSNRGADRGEEQLGYAIRSEFCLRAIRENLSVFDIIRIEGSESNWKAVLLGMFLEELQACDPQLSRKCAPFQRLRCDHQLPSGSVSDPRQNRGMRTRRRCDRRDAGIQGWKGRSRGRFGCELFRAPEDNPSSWLPAAPRGRLPVPEIQVPYRRSDESKSSIWESGKMFLCLDRRIQCTG